MARKLKTKKGKAVYARRKAIVEPVFGQINTRQGKHVLLRGLEKASGEWKLMAGCHNLLNTAGTGRGSKLQHPRRTGPGGFQVSCRENAPGPGLLSRKGDPAPEAVTAHMSVTVPIRKHPAAFCGPDRRGYPVQELDLSRCGISRPGLPSRTMGSGDDGGAGRTAAGSGQGRLGTDVPGEGTLVTNVRAGDIRPAVTTAVQDWMSGRPSHRGHCLQEPRVHAWAAGPPRGAHRRG